MPPYEFSTAALLTRISIGVPLSEAAAFATVSSLATSRLRISTRPVSFCSAANSPLALLARCAAITLSPCARKARVSARPMPRLAPVIRTVAMRIPPHCGRVELGVKPAHSDARFSFPAGTCMSPVIDPALKFMLDAIFPPDGPDRNILGAAGYRDALRATRQPDPPYPLARIEDVKVAGAAGPIGARLYAPSHEKDLPCILYIHG